MKKCIIFPISIILLIISFNIIQPKKTLAQLKSDVETNVQAIATQETTNPTGVSLCSGVIAPYKTALKSYKKLVDKLENKSSSSSSKKPSTIKWPINITDITQSGPGGGSPITQTITLNNNCLNDLYPLRVETLQSINILLADGSGNNLNFYFDPETITTILKKYPNILTNGLYITIAITYSKGQYVTTVSLVDGSNNVYAYGSAYVTIAHEYAYISLNNQDFTNKTKVTTDFTAIYPVPIELGYKILILGQGSASSVTNLSSLMSNTHTTNTAIQLINQNLTSLSLNIPTKGANNSSTTQQITLNTTQIQTINNSFAQNNTININVSNNTNTPNQGFLSIIENETGAVLLIKIIPNFDSSRNYTIATNPTSYYLQTPNPSNISVPINSSVILQKLGTYAVPAGSNQNSVAISNSNSVNFQVGFNYLTPYKSSLASLTDISSIIQTYLPSENLYLYFAIINNFKSATYSIIGASSKKVYLTNNGADISSLNINALYNVFFYNGSSMLGNETISLTGQASPISLLLTQ